MNVLMVTNTFTPHVGGVARSVEGFANEYRRLGHRVLVVAPRFEDAPRHEEGVVRVPALQHFNGSDFSVPVPVPGFMASVLKRFEPGVVHSHHPFLLGDLALRIAAARELPAVFTHHTLYENYVHYVTSSSERMKRFVVELCTGYCELCDAVIAPSESVARRLRELNVTTRTEVIPTGVDLRQLGGGDGPAFRARSGIPEDAFVVGHLGRLAQEKNLGFLTEALIAFLEREPRAVALVAGEGPLRASIRERFMSRGLEGRFFLVGVLERKALADLYAALDVFAFASQSETQGMVLTEAMAAGVPVVAVDASGVREVVRDRENGRLLASEDLPDFVDALGWVAGLEPGPRAALAAGVARTAERFSMTATAERTLALYAELCDARRRRGPTEGSNWLRAKHLLAEEWQIVRNIAAAAGDAWLSAGRPSGQKRAP